MILIAIFIDVFSMVLYGLSAIEYSLLFVDNYSLQKGIEEYRSVLDVILKKHNAQQ